MSTEKDGSLAALALFGKTRREILALLYGHTDRSFHLRQIIRTAGVGHGSVQRELKQLVQAGLLTRRREGRQVYYQANMDSPVFDDLHSLVIKTVGLADVLKIALEPLAGRIAIAFVYGSLAKGTDNANSDVDVMVIGEVFFGEVVSALRASQDRLHREVNPTVYPAEEFQAKFAGGHHFLTRVVREPKLFLIGDADELDRLAQSGMVD